ncbi:MAG: hypothetical protein Q4G05_04695 [Clostridia bacterium]|nr:hypothetical protein [Clostridia bacterium]
MSKQQKQCIRIRFYFIVLPIIVLILGLLLTSTISKEMAIMFIIIGYIILYKITIIKLMLDVISKNRTGFSKLDYFTFKGHKCKI